MKTCSSCNTLRDDDQFITDGQQFKTCNKCRAKKTKSRAGSPLVDVTCDHCGAAYRVTEYTAKRRRRRSGGTSERLCPSCSAKKANRIAGESKSRAWSRVTVTYPSHMLDAQHCPLGGGYV